MPTKILYTEFSPTVNFTNMNFERRNFPRSFGWNCPHRNFTRSFDRKSPHGNLPTVKKGIFPAGTLSRGIIPILENGIFPTGNLSTGIYPVLEIELSPQELSLPDCYLESSSSFETYFDLLTAWFAMITFLSSYIDSFSSFETYFDIRPKAINKRAKIERSEIFATNTHVPLLIDLLLGLK